MVHVTQTSDFYSLQPMKAWPAGKRSNRNLSPLTWRWQKSQVAASLRLLHIDWQWKQMSWEVHKTMWSIFHAFFICRESLGKIRPCEPQNHARVLWRGRSRGGKALSNDTLQLLYRQLSHRYISIVSLIPNILSNPSANVRYYSTTRQFVELLACKLHEICCRQCTWKSVDKTSHTLNIPDCAGSST